MILFGHPYIPSEQFYHIESVEAIRRTPPNSPVMLVYAPENLDIIAHLRRNAIRFALLVETLTDAVLAENLGAAFLIASPKNAVPIQSVAEHYLFNAKVLGYVDTPSHLEKLIDMRLDGAIFPEAIVKITT